MRNLLWQTASCFIGSVLALTLAPTPAAQACSPARCAPSVFLPVSGHVPSNAVEFVWQLPWTSASTGASYAVHLYRLENGQRTELETELIAAADGRKLVRPRQAVAEGSVLVLESAEPECPSAVSTPAMVTVSAATPKPNTLGTLSIVEQRASTTLNIPSSRGSCRADFEVASARIALKLAASAQPFADSLQHALIVDGQKRAQHSEPAPIRNWYPLGGALDDVLYTLCKGSSDSWTADLEAGSHRVQWLSTFPDGSELRSDELTIELQCAKSDADADHKPDAGHALPPADDGTEDDAIAASDPPSTTATEEEASDDDAADRARHVESCAVRAPVSATTGHTWLWLLSAALIWSIRRARAARRCSH
jgi:hypothetical protein